jgi:hypothetical protein
LARSRASAARRNASAARASVASARASSSLARPPLGGCEILDGGGSRVVEVCLLLVEQLLVLVARALRVVEDVLARRAAPLREDGLGLAAALPVCVDVGRVGLDRLIEAGLELVQVLLVAVAHGLLTVAECLFEAGDLLVGAEFVLCAVVGHGSVCLSLEVEDVVGGGGACEQVALGVVDAELLDDAEGRLGLDTLGDGLLPHAAREGHDRLDDVTVDRGLLAVEVAHELLVDLEQVDRKMLEVAKAPVPRVRE